MIKFVISVCLAINLYGVDLLKLKEISLKKDEIFRVFVEYKNIKKLFRLRWTLYKNGVLTLFSDYDKQMFQKSLSLNYNNQSFKIFIYPKSIEYNPPYFLIKFENFDFKKKKAIFSLFIYDSKTEVYVRDLDGE